MTSNLRIARSKALARNGSGSPSKSRKGWNSDTARPASRTMRPTSRGAWSKAMKSCSKISTPSNPARAIAAILSSRSPLSDTVAIDVFMGASATPGLAGGAAGAKRDSGPPRPARAIPFPTSLNLI